MSELNRTTLKTFFETGDTPSEAECANLIDSIPNFIDDSPSDSVSGSTVDFTIIIPAKKMLERIIVYSDNPTLDAVRVGDSVGTTEHAQENIQTGGIPLIIDLFIFAISSRTIHVRVADGVTYKYYIR